MSPLWRPPPNPEDLGPLFASEGREEGRRCRDEILDTHKAVRARLLSVLDRDMVALAESRPDGIVDGDDAWERYEYWRERYETAGRPLPDFDRRFLGAVWSLNEHWRKLGFTQTRIPTRHARPIARWQLVPEEER
jgi:hypothetical protein